MVDKQKNKFLDKKGLSSYLYSDFNNKIKYIMKYTLRAFQSEIIPNNYNFEWLAFDFAYTDDLSIKLIDVNRFPLLLDNTRFRKNLMQKVYSGFIDITFEYIVGGEWEKLA